ncbi:MAG: ankyrin repeat domain-containing protein [Patescibacteria group bacterium]
MGKTKLDVVKINARDGETLELMLKEQDKNLIAAAHWDDLAGVKEALAAGADVNAKDKCGKTALIEASSRWGHTEIVKALLAAGADVNAKDECGDTALIWASYLGYTETARLLRNANNPR